MKELAIRARAYPSDLNHHGDVFGGFIMANMDKAASIAVDAIILSKAVTVSVTHLVFKKPVHSGDIFSIYTEVIKIGRTSITIYVDVEVKNHINNIEYSVTDARFKYVAVDVADKPVAIKKVMRADLDETIIALINNGA